MQMKANVIRLVFICWMFTCVIYAATYSSNLVALLAVDVQQTPFDSMEALSQQQQYRFGVLGGTTYVTVFKVRSSFKISSLNCKGNFDVSLALSTGTAPG